MTRLPVEEAGYVRMTAIWSSLLRTGVRYPPPLPTAPAHSLGGGDAVTTDTRIDPATIEARCRRLMAEHAAIEARGWTSERARGDLREMIDAWLDEWLEVQR